jgi:tRNA nucleotidyltransferase/poly(A) polymerase
MVPFNLNIPRQAGAYIVGGSIRDILLNRPPVDYDIAVLKNPEKFVDKIASRIHYRLVNIGKVGQLLFRVVSNNHVFDITPGSRTSIQEDYEQRDFTINALA